MTEGKVALGNLARIRTGKLDANASSPNGRYPFFTCAINPLRIDTYSYECECVLVAGNGDLNVKYHNGRFDAYQRTYIVEPTSESLDCRYLYHFLDSYLAELRKLSIGGVIKYIKLGNLTEAQIPLPPLEEQRRIAAILDKASTIKQQSAKASALAESLCIARLEQLIATNETLLVARRLEDLCTLGVPITYGILQPGPDLDGGIPYVRPSEIKNSRIDIKSLKRTSPEIAAKYRKSELQEGDILFTIVGTIGEAAVVPAELEGANITQSSARIRIDATRANPVYVYHSLKSQHSTRQISRDRLGVAVERLNLHHVRDMEILCLPMEIQNTYAKEVHFMTQLASRHSLTARHVSSLIQSLTSSLFASGERQ